MCGEVWGGVRGGVRGGGVWGGVRGGGVWGGVRGGVKGGEWIETVNEAERGGGATC